MSTAPLEKVSSNKTFEGEIVKYKFKASTFVQLTRSDGPLIMASFYQSASLGGLEANFNLFLPPNASVTNKVPVLIYLSGLTCTEDNGYVHRDSFHKRPLKSILLSSKSEPKKALSWVRPRRKASPSYSQIPPPVVQASKVRMTIGTLAPVQVST